METFTHHNQPYGSVVFTVDHVTPVATLIADGTTEDYLKVRASLGWLQLRGTVIAGSVTSRLFQHSSTRKLDGESYTLQVPPEAFERGTYTTVAG